MRRLPNIRDSIVKKEKFVKRLLDSQDSVVKEEDVIKGSVIAENPL
jgi:hypothetical protein